MKKLMWKLSVVAVCSVFVFTSCEKEDEDFVAPDNTQEIVEEVLLTGDEDLETAMRSLEAEFFADGEGEKRKEIVAELVKNEGCEFIVSGIVEYYVGDSLVATMDYGDGTCDDVATITRNDEPEEIQLKNRPDGRPNMYEVILEPLVKSDSCSEIVMGIVEVYKDSVLMATIDFGDGTCDNVATVTKDGGEVIEVDLAMLHGKKGPKRPGPRKDSKGHKDGEEVKKGPRHGNIEVIKEEVVKTDSCDHPVSGVIEFYSTDSVLLATLDYGDGTCDNIATITEDGEIIEINLDERPKPKRGEKGSRPEGNGPEGEHPKEGKRPEGRESKGPMPEGGLRPVGAEEINKRG